MQTLKLIRVKQWYKNLLIFLPIIFVGQMFNLDSLLFTLSGFFSLCFISSAAYIINDIFDRERDRVHPEKKYRPIASGELSIPRAIVASAIMLGVGILIALKLPIMFLVAGLAIFILTFIYSVFLKNEAFADILMISINFVAYLLR